MKMLVDGSKQEEKVRTTIQDLFETEDYIFSERNATLAILVTPQIPAIIGRIHAYQVDLQSKNKEREDASG